MSASELARRLDVRHTTVLRWASGQHYPSIPMCARIAAATDGAVRLSDFVRDDADAEVV